jgi:tetratricopeptide (TPR) repeat protein
LFFQGPSIAILALRLTLPAGRETMNYTKAGVLAVGGFALGLVLGRSSVMLPTGSDAARQAPPSMASIGAAHPGVGERSLDDAVRTTLQMSGQATTVTKTLPPGGAAGESAGLIAQAEALRRQRKFDEATAMYRRVVAAGDMTADAWADYADALASTSSSLRGEPAKAIAEALRLEPRHAKALWLKASLEHEEQHYADAVQTWETLLALVPQGSSDADIIRANIAEAARLAGSRS